MEISLIIAIALGLPIGFTVWNIFTFIKELMHKKQGETTKYTEFIAVLVGFIFTTIFIYVTDISFSNWDEALDSQFSHSIISPDYALTFIVIAVIAMLGYIVARYVPLHNQSPIVSVLCIAAIYLGAAQCVFWCVQVGKVYILMVFPLNLLLLFAKTILILARQKSGEAAETPPEKLKFLSKFLGNSAKLPLIALFLAIPLLGLIVAVLCLFGQEPNSFIKVWTETADWVLSQKIAPPDIPHDGHYLCTVAATGHQKIVKPLRTGNRHGHTVIVNCQLCIANAFEQVLQEKLPRTHRAIRNFYDKTGYPISKHIKSKLTADVIYFIMKPLEWFFLFVIYLIDAKPEDRIATQYPHTSISK